MKPKKPIKESKKKKNETKNYKKGMNKIFIKGTSKKKHCFVSPI
jgi:hypothetical protein